MIAYVSGKLAALGVGWVVVDVNGLGYRLAVPSTAELPGAGQEIKLHTHMAVREDGISLYGFCNEEELECFLALLEVAGVGPKVALAVIASLKPDKLRQVIASGDLNQLVKVPGVGKKTAQRILLELKDKLKTPAVMHQSAALVVEPTDSGEEAMLALLSLGYGQNEAREALNKVVNINPQGNVADMIKAALKELAPAR